MSCYNLQMFYRFFSKEIKKVQGKPKFPLLYKITRIKCETDVIIKYAINDVRISSYKHGLIYEHLSSFYNGVIYVFLGVF